MILNNTPYFKGSLGFFPLRLFEGTKSVDTHDDDDDDDNVPMTQPGLIEHMLCTWGIQEKKMTGLALKEFILCQGDQTSPPAPHSTMAGKIGHETNHTFWKTVTLYLIKCCRARITSAENHQKWKIIHIHQGLIQRQTLQSLSSLWSLSAPFSLGSQKTGFQLWFSTYFTMPYWYTCLFH